ncbi:aminodeoxychorismate lyase [Colletotrichum tabaci]|uniref:Aminodeoxychorismate lyase n=1 Tax=Colletotrichum tabaci TaxID=1209068 RepID=A0AAV9TIZ9_9PEZI
MAASHLDSASEAILSDPNFEIITTLAYSTGLPTDPRNKDTTARSACYLLQFGIDRLHAAATDFSWPRVLQELEQENQAQTVAKKIESHMISAFSDAASDPGRRFIVRLAFKKEGGLHIMAGPRPANQSIPMYPTSLGSTRDETISAIPVYVDYLPTSPSLFTKHKTTHRKPYSTAWARVGLDETTSPAECDVLLHNHEGQVTGAVFRTAYFWREGAWVTPGSESGCKLGVSRRWALDVTGWVRTEW